EHVDRPVVLNVVDDEDERAFLLARRRRPARPDRLGLAGHGDRVEGDRDPTGMIRVKVEPSRSLLSSVIRPRRTVARRRQIASPRPVPAPSRVWAASAWENGSKIRAWSASAIPIPVSATAIASSRLARRCAQLTVTEPRGVNRRAFVR